MGNERLNLVISQKKFKNVLQGRIKMRLPVKQTQNQQTTFWIYNFFFMNSYKCVFLLV